MLFPTAALYTRYGNPFINQATFQKRWMTIWEVPNHIRLAIPCLPEKIYTNTDALPLLKNVFEILIQVGVAHEIKSYDGCFNVRAIRNSKKFVPSRHAFGIAFDFNAAENPLGKDVCTWSEAFLQVWRDCGFVCGADWKMPRRDSMHFEIPLDFEKYQKPIELNNIPLIDDVK